MKSIPLTKGKVALVDDCDYHWLSQLTWHYTKRGYAAADMFGGRKGRVRVYMHRLILMAMDTATVDHRNHDTIDNRRKNLRHATLTQQNANRRKFKGSSKYKGVYRRWDGLKWVTQISKNDVKRSIACHESENDAARCYNAMARYLFGENALFNDVKPRFPARSLALRYINRWESPLQQGKR